MLSPRGTLVRRSQGKKTDQERDVDRGAACAERLSLMHTKSAVVVGLPIFRGPQSVPLSGEIRRMLGRWNVREFQV